MRNEPHVSVVVHVNLDEDTMTGGFEDGAPLSRADLLRYLCDCGVNRVVMNGNPELLDLGRSTKTPSKAQRRALRRRDRGGRWRGCCIKASVCHAHTSTPGSRGGPPPPAIWGCCVPSPP